MSQHRRLIVGLGNPGAQYNGTRHNIGYRVIETLADQLDLALKSKGEALLAWGRYRGRPIGLAKPVTFMNRSGTAVETIVRKNRLLPIDLLVVSDDINLPPGQIRIRESGGAGGHNGLEDIIDWLDTDAFPRMRLGIGSDFERGRQSDYVLSRFGPEEEQLIGDCVRRACDAALAFVVDGIVTAMNRFNG